MPNQSEGPPHAACLPAELLVCTRCRRGQVVPDEAKRPGELLHDSLAEASLPEGVVLTPVECLSNCSNGCTIVLRGQGRWTYIYGNLHETDDLDAVREGIALYRAAEDGIVPWKERPERFKRNCVARIPPLGFAPQEAANV